MKMTRKDLEDDILLKLDRLDDIVNNTTAVTDGFISYNPEKGFYFKKTNDTFLRKVYSEDEIISLKEDIKNPKTNEYSTDLGIEILDDSYNYATNKMIHYLNPVLKIPSFSKSSIRKFINNRYYAYFKLSGEFIVADMKNNFNIIYHNQILTNIQETFNLSKDIRVYNIVDFIFDNNDTIIVATDFFGTYKYNLKNDEVEVLFNAESRIRCIELTHTNKLFVACDDFCAIYDLEGNLIEKYFNIVESNQIPYKIFKTSTDILVLGKATGINQLDSLLHGWTLDEAEVGYNCIDKVIMPNPTDNYYQIFSTQLTDDYLFIYTRYYDEIHAWKYDLDSLEIEDLKISDNAKNVLDVLFAGNSFVISERDKFVVFGENINRIYTGESLVNLIVFDNGVLGFTEDFTSASQYEIKQFVKHIDDIVFRCALKEQSNNIDLLIVNGAKLNIRFNNDEGRNIQPAFVAQYGNDYICKFLNCPEKNFNIKIHVDEATVLDGIILKSNKMFLR